MHTEDEAKKLWCPMARFHRGGDGDVYSNRPGGQANDSTVHCIGRACAMWRWTGKSQPNVKPQDAEPLGFCGLAGRPE